MVKDQITQCDLARKVIKIPFYDLYTDHGHVPDLYSRLLFKQGNTTLYEQDRETEFQLDLTTAYSISLFPSTTIPEVSFDTTAVITKKIEQRNIKGFAIEIPENTDFKTFLLGNFSKSFRSKIKRSVNRFEGCFEVNYLMFYGKISKQEYEYHMLSLKKMLEDRFEEKGEENRVLNEWATYYNTTYDLINAKKCSLWVIQANSKNVQVCINRHHNSILNISVPSYDIAYSRFGLGNISIYKLLEWSIERNYSFIDMEYGAYEYKRRWSTKIYDFYHYVYYPSKWSTGNLLGRIEVLRLTGINFLKSLKVDKYIESIKKVPKVNRKKPYTALFKDEIIESIDDNMLCERDFQQLEGSLIKRMIIDVVFQRKLILSEVKVYTDTKDQNILYLINKTSIIKIQHTYPH